MQTNNCIKNLLKLIHVLQDNSKNLSCLDEGCLKPFLGPSLVDTCYDTRVITLYTKNGELFTANYYDDNNVVNMSFLFRIQKVDDDCCTLLILVNDGDEYISTRQTITVKISCICAIKCIEDTVVTNL